MLSAKKPRSNPLLGCRSGGGNPVLRCGLRSNPVLGRGLGGGILVLSCGPSVHALYVYYGVWYFRVTH